MSAWRAAPELEEGLALLRAGAAHAAHESFEAVWRRERGTALAEVARALAQWSAACACLAADRPRGFASLAAKSARVLASEPVDRAHGTRALSDWIAARGRAGDAGGRLPPEP